MNISKFILTGALALCGAAAHAQYVTAYPPLPAGFSVAAGTTNTAIASSNVVFEVTRGTQIAVQPKFRLTGSGTSDVVFMFETSVDAVTWSASQLSVSVTATGTNVTSALATLNVGGAGFLRLSAVENPNGAAVTNLVIATAYKVGL